MFPLAAAGQRELVRRAGQRPRRALRALAEPGARPARGIRRAAGRLPGRGDRHPRRGAGARADHGRRQPARLDVRTAGRLERARRDPRLHGRGRHLRQRDHPPRRRDPARARAAREVALRPRALPARRAQRGQLLAGGDGGRRCRPSGRCCSAWRASWRARGRTPTSRRSTPGRRDAGAARGRPARLARRGAATPASCWTRSSRAGGPSAARLHAARRPLRRRLRGRPGGPHARAARAQPARRGPRPARAPPPGGAAHAVGPDRARARADRGRPRAPAGGAARGHGTADSCWSAAASCARTTPGCTTCRRS